MSLDDFLHDVFSAAQVSAICGTPVVLRLRAASVKIRVPVIDKQFIDFFYDEMTGSMSFALIKNNRRVYGTDNTGGWHVHPFEDPRQHEPLDGPMSVMQLIQNIELRLRQS